MLIMPRGGSYAAPWQHPNRGSERGSSHLRFRVCQAMMQARRLRPCLPRPLADIHMRPKVKCRITMAQDSQYGVDVFAYPQQRQKDKAAAVPFTCQLTRVPPDTSPCWSLSTCREELLISSRLPITRCTAGDGPR